MLSGGATWGFHHLGVVKALFEHGVLPHILSGASTGAMIAAGVCARTDAEIAAMFADTDQIRLDGLLPVGVRRALQDGALLDPAQLLAVLRHNVGDCTFAEAFARSGRALNISVSPTRTRQKPRLLSHLTAPDVLVARAALASSALPGLFPPVVLEARDPSGRVVPYVPSERWVDGSLYEDLPKLRLARLHNVNHFIVSQTNPHVVPFVGHQGQRGLFPAVAGVATSAAHTQSAYAAELARRVTPRSAGPLRQLADRAYALASQDYHGDIDIHPAFRVSLLRKVVANPTRADLAAFIREGERATWPKLAMITDQTRLGRVFQECVAKLG
jgi:NTE family protein